MNEIVAYSGHRVIVGADWPATFAEERFWRGEETAPSIRAHCREATRRAAPRAKLWGDDTFKEIAAQLQAGKRHKEIAHSVKRNLSTMKAYIHKHGGRCAFISYWSEK